MEHQETKSAEPKTVKIGLDKSFSAARMNEQNMTALLKDGHCRCLLPSFLWPPRVFVQELNRKEEGGLGREDRERERKTFPASSLSLSPRCVYGTYARDEERKET